MEVDRRSVLVGMNNPVSSKPEHALYPYPEGCTGHRLLAMLQTRNAEIGRREYLARFDRRNVVSAKLFDKKMAQRGAADLFAELFGTGRTVVLLGADTVRAFGIPPLLIHPQSIGGCMYRQIPHPSGRNLWYNDEQNRLLVSMLLEDLYNAAE